jgi:hypothetical protein
VDAKSDVPLAKPPKKPAPDFDEELGPLPVRTTDSYHVRPSLLVWFPLVLCMIACVLLAYLGDNGYYVARTETG